MSKINSLLIFTYLAIFPFGQLPSLVFSVYLAKPASLPISDIILLVLLALNIKNIFKMQFLLAILFSTLFSLTLFPLQNLTTGFLYFLRLVSFINLGIVIFELYKTEKSKIQLIKQLLAVIFIICLLGWLQYLFLPDTRQLFIFGWDDHYYRLIGTFLDPAFTGIIITLGAILSVFLAIQFKHKKYWVLTSFFVLTLLFTYSRASYIAFAVSFTYLIWKYFSKKIIFIYIVLFIVAIGFLPRAAGGEGVRLERIFSVVSKIQNSSEGLSLFYSSPLFGYGYNNVCLLQKQNASRIVSPPHSCSGFDNSILFFLVTTGIVGLFVLFFQYIKLLKNINKKYFGLCIALTIAIFVHGMFTNTFVYPFIMGFMAIIFGVSYKLKDYSKQ